MLLENELVEMKWHPTNRLKYIELGYKYTNFGDIFYPKAIDVLKCSSGAKIPVQCDYCGNTYYPTSRNYEKSRKRKDKDCCVSCKGKEIKETFNAKYGVDNVMLLSDIREKYINTCMERYGVPSPLHNAEIFQKTQDSLNKHYGVENGIKDLRSIKEISDKIESTNIEKYGGKAPLCSKEIRIKVNETMYKNGTCKTSKPQIMLCDMIKKRYGNCELNYPCDQLSLDCMTIIDGVKIDVEYDGWYWHKNKTEEDRRRDYFIESNGYKVIRFVAYDDRLPTDEELVNAINKMITTTRKHTKVELNKI